MPTVLLLDLAGSMARTVAPELTRHELVQRCVLHFLRALEELQPLEQVSLITFASAAHVAVPFTRDHSLLRSALYDLQLQDKSSLDVGLRGAFDLVQERWGVELPAQVVVFSDGIPSSAAQVLAVRTLARVRVHIVAFGTKGESGGAEVLRELAHSHYGCFSFLQLPEELSRFKEVVDNIVRRFYTPWRGSVAVGHLQAPMTLYPEPSLPLFFASLSYADIPLTLPPILSVLGFLPQKSLPSPPCIFRHIVRLRYVIIRVLPVESGPTPPPNVLVMLHESMKADPAKKFFAVVYLAEEWLGLLSPHTDANRPCLSLSILFPRQSSPVLGLLSELVTHPVSKADNFEAPPKSYTQSKGSYQLPVPSNDVVNWQRISRLCKALPAKRDLLVTEIDRCRAVAQAYHLPAVNERLMELLKAEIAEVNPEGEAARILRDLSWQVSGRPAEPRRVAVNSLLN